MREYPYIDHWTKITLEMYCSLNWGYESVKDPYIYVMDDNHNFDNLLQEPNPHYNPNISPDPFPDNCIRELTIRCLDCPYVTYCEYDEDLEIEEEGLK